MSEWIEWRGGERPVPHDAEVDVRFRDGAEELKRHAYGWAWEWAVDALSPYDIIAYRLSSVEPSKEANGSKPTVNPKDLVGVRKAPMSCVPANVLAELGTAMLEGACKYGRHNYREAGAQASIYYDGTMRHLMAWWEGQDTDPDSGLSHITKAIASLVVLRDTMLSGRFIDDRPPVVDANFLEALNQHAGEIIDKHADKKPKHYTKHGAVR